jgi:hypothetical protein
MHKVAKAKTEDPELPEPPPELLSSSQPVLSLFTLYPESQSVHTAAPVQVEQLVIKVAQSEHEVGEAFAE